MRGRGRKEDFSFRDEEAEEGDEEEALLVKIECLVEVEGDGNEMIDIFSSLVSLIHRKKKTMKMKKMNWD